MCARQAWQTTATGLRLTVRVSPRASRDCIERVVGLTAGEALKVAVSVAPQDGKANAAVCRLLARFFRTAKSNVTVASGASSRLKQIDVAGDGASLAAVLDAWRAQWEAAAQASKERQR